MYRTDKEDKDMNAALCLQYLQFLFELVVFLYLVSKDR